MTIPDSQPISVLIDRNVTQHAIIARPKAVNTILRWGGACHLLEHFTLRKKPSLPESQSWLQDQIGCIPTIARLACEGKLSFHTHNELMFEEWRDGRDAGKSDRIVRGTVGDLFAGINMAKVPLAVERSWFSQTIDFGKQISKEELTAHCKFLISLDTALLEREPLIWDRLPDFVKRNLGNLDFFKELCRGLAESQYVDAFHLWAGEASGLDFFLTVDKKFVNSVRNTFERAHHCEPVFPDELLDRFGMVGRDPMPTVELDMSGPSDPDRMPSQ